MTKKNKIRFVCPKCGKEPERDKDMSTNNWAVISAECPTCKCRLKLEIDGVTK
jgi:predicted RNA-binding Zn-ribbon protein involved in translation (DUF1610 family)